MNNTESFFPKELSKIAKGIAIILMLSLHLLKPEWMAHPERIVDIPMGESNLSSVLARGGDICIGIFAFITGYGWRKSHSNKNIIERTIGIGGNYWTYWLILLTFSFPIRVFMTYIVNGMMVHLTIKDVIFSILAISSASVKFQWYIYFFALALVTHKLVYKITCRNRINPVLRIYVICIVFIALRYLSTILFTKIINNSVLHGITSHYFQWMPVIVMGSIVQDEELFEKADVALFKHKKTTKNKIIPLVCVILYLGKCFFCYVTGIYSNVDSFIMLPFMFSLIALCKKISKIRVVNDCFLFLGSISMYIWLMHSVFLYQPIQIIVDTIRIPIIILAVDILIISVVSYSWNKLDLFVQNWIRHLM